MSRLLPLNLPFFLIFFKFGLFCCWVGVYGEGRCLGIAPVVASPPERPQVCCKQDMSSPTLSFSSPASSPQIALPGKPDPSGVHLFSRYHNLLPGGCSDGSHRLVNLAPREKSHCGRSLREGGGFCSQHPFPPTGLSLGLSGSVGCEVGPRKGVLEV